MNALTIKLWAVFCLTVFGGILANYFGIFHMLWDADITKISFGMLTFLAATMLFLIISVWTENIPDLKPYWYIAETFLSMGLVGTLIGMIYVFTAVDLPNIDISNAANVKSVMISMAVGIATKLWTTLVGLVCSIILKLYLVLIENFQHKAELEMMEEHNKKLRESFGLDVQ